MDLKKEKNRGAGVSVGVTAVPDPALSGAEQ